MDTFDRQWNAYTKRANFFAHYNHVYDLKQIHGMYQLQNWYKLVLRSQFENSADKHDRISLIHWTVDIGNREDFIVDNYIVPFHAIVKTPIMEYWYSHANVNRNVLHPYIRQRRRLPLFDEHTVIQPYYHTKFECSILNDNDCFTFKNCNRTINSIPQLVMPECEKLSEEVF